MHSAEYGYFDDAAREFVITNPATPFPWVNYLGSEDFFGIISNTAGGYSFYKDAKFRRLTRYRYNGVPTDSGGRYYYIADGSCVWSPGWKPTKTPLDFYECRHGMNYTRITGRKDGVSASLLCFVPLHERAEVHRLTLANHGKRAKCLRIFSLAEWCLWNAATDMENFQRNLSTGEVEIDLDPIAGADGTPLPATVIYHKTEYKERRNHYAYYSVNAAAAGYDTDREEFLGAYNGFDAPQAVMAGQSRNSLAHGWSPVASHCVEVRLQPGEERELIFVLGYAELPDGEKFCDDGKRKRSGRLITSQASDVTFVNKHPAHATVARFHSPAAVEAAFAELRAAWDGLLGRFHVTSSEPRLDRMVNIWNPYQCMVTFCFSRSASFFESGVGRGMGFRDSNQDLAGFVHLIPQRARQRILDIAATQFADGGCYHQYQPLTRRGNNDIGGGFNDDPLWLLFGTVAYLKETADFSILAEPVPWDNRPGSEVPLLEHLRISFRHVTENLGPHGLPLIGRADWNDCLNLNCFSTNPDESFQTTENRTEGSQAESLMIAGLYVYCGRDYVELLQYLADHAVLPAEALPFDAAHEATDALQRIGRMEESVRLHGWDGEWYLRAYDYYGRKIGSHENDEGKIFIESQGFCAMAGIGRDEGMVKSALDSCRLLDTPHGMVLNYPAFTTYHPEMGEISTYPAGYKENGGIFCHNNPWVAIAEVLDNRPEAAWEHYTKICPAWVADQHLHRVEPYVYCQMVAGRDAALPGEGKNSWLTGTAAWNWLLASQYILGVRPTYGGLELAPCLPRALQEATIRRTFRGAHYEIRIRRRTPDGDGRIASATLDGVPISLRPCGTAFVEFAPGEHHVELLLD